MNEIQIKFSLESPQEKNKDILITVENSMESKILYKFIAGIDSVWTTLKDFSEEKEVLWTPDKEGKYIIMVQAKRHNSARAFDYISKADYIIGNIEEKLILDVHIDRKKIQLGDKFNVNVETSKIPLMFKYWIKGESGWELIKDYCPENKLLLTAKEEGQQEILVECKNLDSKNNFDDFKTVKFKVDKISKLEITNFTCLTTELLAEEELIFQVDAVHEDNRMILYKFMKIDSKGITKCLQDYSTKRMISYNEKEPGAYKLLCLAKDMYSKNSFDDRAVITYEVAPYKEINIKSFTTDLSSPQIIGRDILLKAVVEGGRKLLYRYKIEGNFGEDSGYIRSDSYVWKTKHSGDYRITLMVKDESYKGEYEEIYSLDYKVDDKSFVPIRVKEIILSKEGDYVKGEPINITAIAEGGISLKYSFLVFKNSEVIEAVEYGDCNWVNFTPEEAGEYDLEIRIKDKLSSKDYDYHSILHFKVKEYLPAEMDYILLNSKEYYMVEDDIALEIIARNTNNILLKYILNINGHLAEETDFITNKKYSFKPKCSGRYVVTVLAKNKESKEQYDSKQEIRFYIQDSLPVTDTKIKSDKSEIYINMPLIFNATSHGGKDVVYEFYLMEQGEWRRVQGYSKKNFYSFIPFIEGEYKLLVLSKSEYKKVAYEDYSLFEFTAKEDIVD